MIPALIGDLNSWRRAFGVFRSAQVGLKFSLFKSAGERGAGVALVFDSFAEVGWAR